MAAHVGGRRGLRVAVGAVLAGAVSAVLAAGTAHAAPTIAQGATYVAMGSSYAAGPGLLPALDVGCMRSGGGYAHRVADHYRLHLIDVTCSGATISDILTKSQRIFHGSVPPQIDAVTPDTRLVTVTIGGNDLGYVGGMIAMSCHNSLPHGTHKVTRVCVGATRRAVPATAASLDAVEHALIKMVGAVRTRAPHATVVLADYLPALNASGTVCPTVPLTPAQAITFRHTYEGLLAVTERAAKATGATLAHATDAGSDHTACTHQPWVTGFEIPNPAAGHGIPYHPTDAGMAAEATAVVSALDNGSTH